MNKLDFTRGERESTMECIGHSMLKLPSWRHGEGMTVAAVLDLTHIPNLALSLLCIHNRQIAQKNMLTVTNQNRALERWLV